METKQALFALAALAQETRLSIFRLLVQAGPSGKSVSEIGEAVGSAPATLSFHLKEMAHAGLIASRQQGRYVFYSANYVHMNALLAYLTENCCARDSARSAGTCEPDCAPGRSGKRAKVRSAR
jgi:ArsR family transcriptional regulator